MGSNLDHIIINGPFWKAAAKVINLSTPTAASSILLLSENFEDFAQNAHPENWRDTKSGFSLVEEEIPKFKIYKLEDDLHFGTTSTGANIHSHYNNHAAGAWTNYILSGRLRLSHVNGRAGITFYSQFKEGGSADYYRLSNTGSNQEWQLIRLQAGVEAANPLGSTGVGAQEDTFYQFLIETETTDTATNIRAKIWEDGTTQPVAYQIDFSDTSTDRLTAGTIGTWTRGSGRKYFDGFQVIGMGALNYRAIRGIYNDHPSSLATDSSSFTLLPGTKVAICDVYRVEVNLYGENNPGLVWERDVDEFGDAGVATDTLTSHIRDGRLSLLVLRTLTLAENTDPVFRCLNGYINLDLMTPDNGASDQLLEALTLTEVTGRLSTGKENLPGAIAVHSSGLSVLGEISLPWIRKELSQGVPQKFAAPFQLIRVFPGDEQSIVYHLQLETERFTATETKEWVEAWQELSTYVNPKNPQNPVLSLLENTPVPNWVALELVDLFTVPDLFWTFTFLTDNASDSFEEPNLFFPRGTVNLYFSEQQLYDQDNIPTTVVQVIPKMIQIPPLDGTELQLNLVAGSESSAISSDAKLSYHANLVVDNWTESIQCEKMTLSYDAIETPRILRDAQGIPTPDWILPASDEEDPIPIEQPLVWAFMPLEGGWAQLPIFNLTEQIYLDAALEQEPDFATLGRDDSFRGAVTFSNRLLPKAADEPSPEQPWDVTLINAVRLEGTFRLAFNTVEETFELQEVQLDLFDPEVAFNGLMWFSTGRPRVIDALPDLENWITGLFPVNLKTIVEAKTIFPPAMSFALDALQISPGEERPTPISPIYGALGFWEIQYSARPSILQAMIDKGVIPVDPLRQYLPLVWLRDPVLPTIQALPLTQSQNPPNHPSASRQLAPCIFETNTPEGELYLPDNWIFKSIGANGSNTWLSAKKPLKAALEWASNTDLPMAMLSLPGLIMDPVNGIDLDALNEENIARGLKGQFRFDLPYADEVFALAQLPKEPQDPEELTPIPDAPPPPLPKPLIRETLQDHWEMLSNLAQIASADATDAWKETDGQLGVYNLIEPLEWPVSVIPDLVQYPGSIHIKNNSNGENINLREKSALKGISGKFARTTPNGSEIQLDENAEHPFEVEAHSMAAFLSDDGTSMRDQRGLSRSFSHPEGPDGLPPIWLQTKVESEGEQAYNLSTALSAISLQIPGNDNDWLIWMKDLPLEIQADKEVFNWSITRSPLALDEENGSDQDINDPEGLSKDYNFLQGYEWRLNQKNTAQETPETPLLNLLKLRFYPLRLESVIYQNQEIQEVAIHGRLQLPLENGDAEQEDLNNVVRLVFRPQAAGTPLVLDEVEVVSGTIEWPIDVSDAKPGEVPRLCFSEISLGDNGDGKFFKLQSASIKFLLFEADWRISLVDLDLSSGTVSGSFDPPDDPIGMYQNAYFLRLDLNLNPDTLEFDFQHELYMVFDVRLGNQERAAFDADVRFYLAGEKRGVVEVEKANLFDALSVDLQVPELVGYTRQALQFHWENYHNIDNLSFLPGIPLNVTMGLDNPGFATLSFQVVPTGGGSNDLILQTSFVEILLITNWGDYLQSTTPITLNSSFEASAGAITIGYTTEYKKGGWQDGFLLNGNMEVKNLISWPADLVLDEQGLLLSTPTVDEDNSLRHLRHCIRVLLNQHQLPSEILEVVDPSESEILSLFRIKPTLTWQFLAITEHQVIELDTAALIESTDGSIDRLNEFRWTALQEIRWIPTPRYRKFLEFVSGKDLDEAGQGSIEVDPQPLDPDNLPETITIRGRVVGSSGRGIPNVKVAIYYPTPPIQVAGTSTITTGVDGRFEFPGLIPNSLELFSNTGPSILFEIFLDNNTIFIEREDSIVWNYEIGEAEILFEIDYDVQSLEYMPAALAEQLVTAIDQTEKDILLVEASAPHWIKLDPIENTGFTNLQFLPNGLQSAILSGPTDYGLTDPRDPKWLLLQVPFLGRLQKHEAIYVDTQQAIEDSSQLLIDPVFNLYLHRESNTTPSGLLLSLTSHAASADSSISISTLDLSEINRWPELDAQSLEENWLRLSNPPTEIIPAFLQSITASFQDNVSRSSRASAMSQIFIAQRESYPPSPMAFDQSNPLPTFGRTGAIIWREDSLLEFDYSSFEQQDSSTFLTWIIAGLNLQSILDISKGEDATGATDSDQVPVVKQYVSVTLLPTPDTSKEPNSLAVSPYLGLAYLSSATQRTLQMVSSELLCLDTVSGALRPTASKLWELVKLEVAVDGDLTVDNYLDTAKEWAREMHARLCPESPLAVLRFRRIEASANDETNTAPLTTTYGFQWVRPIERSQLIKRVFNLRTEVQNLRFREGQFGGFRIPDIGHLYELAPPQVNGVQPIYLDTIGANEESQLDRDDQQLAGALPWGLSTIRLSTQVTKDRKAVVGAQPTQESDLANLKLWWQSVQHFVQFRAEGAAAGLPNKFRARAIKTLLPVLNNLPLPAEDIRNFLKGEADASGIPRLWQPVLPGFFRTMPVGSRAGVPFVYRNQLLRQSLIQTNDEQENNVLISGSIPVQHRFPRPVSLPENKENKPGKALQTWASFFAQTKALYHQKSPIDEAFFADCGAEPARGLQLILTRPKYGAVTVDWNGTLIFEAMSWPDPLVLTDWVIEIELSSGKRLIEWVATEPLIYDLKPNEVDLTNIEDNPEGGVRDLLKTILNELKPGASKDLTVKVRHVNGNPGYLQTLRFPLRLTQAGPTILPLEPYFIHFEDPEYNRHLSSSSASAGRQIKMGDDLVALKLSTDRKIYNNTSRIAMRFDWDYPIEVTGTITNTNYPAALRPAALSISFQDDPNSDDQLASLIWSGPIITTENLSQLDEMTVGNAELSTLVNSLKEKIPFEYGTTSENERTRLVFKRVDPITGVAQEITSIFFDTDGQPIAQAKLLQLSIPQDIVEKLGAEENALVSGDVLSIELHVVFKHRTDPVLPVGQDLVVLSLDIVEEPVIPVTESAYGLLRAQTIDTDFVVDCPRFAWSPNASRTELVCPDDLLTEIVRRRAVFQWTSTVRPGRAVDFGLQKIAQNGSTHFPKLPGAG